MQQESATDIATEEKRGFFETAGKVVLPLLLVAVFAYQMYEELSSTGYESPFEDREVDDSDPRFKGMWLAMYAGKWVDIETSAILEIGHDQSLTWTTPEGETRRGFAGYMGPGGLDPILLIGWYDDPDKEFPTRSGNATMMLTGVDTAIWNVGYEFGVGSDGEMTTFSGSRSELRRLTANRQGNDVQSDTAISGYLAFVCDEIIPTEVDGDTRFFFDICIANIDGNDVRKITGPELRSTGPNVRVDAKGRVLFACSRDFSPSGLCASESDGGGIYALAVNPDLTYDRFVVNSSGDVVSFCSDSNQDHKRRIYQICTFNLDGSGFKQVTKLRNREFAPWGDMGPSINDAGEISLRCFEGDDETEMCGISEDGGVFRLTEERSRPRYFYRTHQIGPDGLVVYSCSKQANTGQLCILDTRTGEIEDLTYWVSPYFKVSEVDINNKGQVVFKCWNNLSKGRRLCGAILGKPGFWYITDDEEGLGLENPQIDDSGNIIVQCHNRAVDVPYLALCRTNFEGTFFEKLNLDPYYLNSLIVNFSDFDISR